MLHYKLRGQPANISVILEKCYFITLTKWIGGLVTI